MRSTILYSRNNFTIHRYDYFPEEAISFLKTIAWGSNGTLYKHNNTEDHIRALKDPILFALWQTGRIQATTVLSLRKMKIAGNDFNCYYFRYFAIDPSLRGSGIMPRYSQQILKSLQAEEKEKTIYFSYIEKSNKNSFRVTELAGLKKTATFKTTGFSRFFPKWDKRIESLKAEEKMKMIQQLNDFYSAHTFVQFQPLLNGGNYHVIRHSGHIIAGCQYHRVHWTIKSLPGLKGKIIMNLVPYLPLLKRVFNPRRFQFLALEAIYFKEGHENELKNLIAGLLAKEKLHSAIFWMGENCPHHNDIIKKIRLGFFHSFVKNSDGFIMTASKHLDDEAIKILRSGPAYVSAFDNI